MAKISDDISDLEAAFLYYWRAFAPEELPEPQGQFKYFDYRLDYAFPDVRLAIELDGGRGGGFGRAVVCHACGATVRARRADGSPGKPLRVPYPSHSGQGAERDTVKQNLLVIGGWYPLRFSSAMFDSNPGGCIDQIVRLYKRLKSGEK